MVDKLFLHTDEGGKAVQLCNWVRRQCASRAMGHWRYKMFSVLWVVVGSKMLPRHVCIGF